MTFYRKDYKIDWEAQWAVHAQNFSNGFVHLDFKAYQREAPPIRLKPGGGFGDLSHPTTRLALKMVAKNVKNQIVVDIGCGSGILSLAAAALGAEKCYGLDIEAEALEHSKQNAHLNQLSHKCFFCRPEKLKLDTSSSLLILMNMIQSEQLIAWNSLPILHSLPGNCITSGIRQEHRDSYLQQTKQWGWHLIEELNESEWLAFHFRLN